MKDLYSLVGFKEAIVSNAILLQWNGKFRYMSFYQNYLFQMDCNQNSTSGNTVSLSHILA